MDERATAEAFRLYAPAVYARCVRVLRDRDAAGDITQEVFVRCVRERESLRTGRELLGWLYRVATNLCLNQLRAQKLRAGTVDSEREPIAAPVDPDRHLIQRALQGLDARTQAMAIYVHVDGMTHAEAGEVAGVTDRTVRNCLARFLAHAREQLGAEEEPTHDPLSVRLQSRRP